MMPITTNSSQRLTEEQRSLAESYLPFCIALAQEFIRARPSDRDEFESAAQMGLVRAAAAYSSTYSVRFSTFARFYVRGNLLDAYRKIHRIHYRETSSGLLMDDWVVDNREKSDGGDLIKEFIDTLKPEYKSVFYDMFVLKHTMKQVCESYHISRYEASKIRKACLERCRVKLKLCGT